MLKGFEGFPFFSYNQAKCCLPYAKRNDRGSYDRYGKAHELRYNR